MAAKFGFGASNQVQTVNPFGSVKSTSNTPFSSSSTGSVASSGSLFGNLGTTTISSVSGVFGGMAATKQTGFGTAGFGVGVTNKSAGTGIFRSTASITPAFGFGGSGNTGGFGQPQVLEQQQQQQVTGEEQTVNPLNAMTTALSMPMLFGDERDAILAMFNQIQSLWGAGKGYYIANQQAISFTMDNPFCRFKAIGYSCLPNAKDSDGLIGLDLKHSIDFVNANQQQLVESLHKILGASPTLLVCVDGVRELPENRTEVIFYIMERVTNGTLRRIPAKDLFMFLSQKSYKDQLTALGAENMLPKTSLTEPQLGSFLENPPLGIDPIIWEQAKKDNPLPRKLIPVPMIGFSELLNRLKHQEHEAEQHKIRIDLMSDEVMGLQKAHSTTIAKLSEYKRKHLEVGHRTLEIIIQQQSRRKIGYAIEPEEEQLQVQLESIFTEINSPSNLKGRLSELMSQIRMQAHDLCHSFEQIYAMDETLQREIKQHLERQQRGMQQLVGIVRDDLEDLKTIEHGFSEAKSLVE